MDIRQPSISLGTKGDVAAAVNARFMQDAYRALKTPNCSMGIATDQDITSHTWTKITFPVTYHNNLNLYDTVNNTISPMGVPGMYYIDCGINFYDETASAPSAGGGVQLVIRSPSSAIRASARYDFPNSTAVWVNTYLSLRVTCLDYLSGLRGAGEDDYREIWIYHNIGHALTVMGTTVYTDDACKLNAFKIPY